MAERPRLEIVDDPVMRADAPAPPAPPGQPQAGPAPNSTEPSQTLKVSSRQPQAPEPAPALAPHSFRTEEKRAVFGRIPRSLRRRLERVVVELREDMDDLTQEQVLAALLYQYVDPADPERIRELADTVRAYLGRL
jgi:hypothetical protein